MKPNMRRNFPGSFRACDLGGDSWRLTCTEPKPIDVLVSGAESRTVDVLGLSSIADLGMEWGVNAVVMTMTVAGLPNTVLARSVIVHEPLPQLYDTLPLAGLDEKTRRFWRKVFRLVRLPGGRFLLGVMARRSRGGR